MSERTSYPWPATLIACVFASMLLAPITTPEAARAQQTTPIATPADVPCDVAPRSATELIADLTAFRAAGGTPESPQRLPPGHPADPATTAAIAAVVRQLEACINTGDQLRVYGLFSDALFRQPMSPELVAELKEELTSLAQTTPTPIPVGQRQVLIGPWHVEILEDGRVMAAVQFGFESGVDYPSSTKALFFVRQSGHWLIEEMTDTLWRREDPGPVPVEDVVGPPPSH